MLKVSVDLSAGKTVTAPDAPAAVGPYCHAKLCNGVHLSTLYCSGQLGLDPVTGELPQGVEAQAHQALKNLGAVLKAGGMDYSDVVKTTVFLTDINDFAAVNTIYAQYFTAEPPARSCVEVASLPKGGLVEVEAVAVK
jgi:2-iminobutanoate/2-iminopropanoate deaminase